jgi:phosphotransferase system enzyme I (PtsI)
VDWTKVRGFATDAGSRTYHTAILARSLEVPAVVGLHEASELIQPGQIVVIDGDENEIIVDQTPETLARAEQRRDDRPAAQVPKQNDDVLRQPRTACASVSTRTSSSPTISRRRGTAGAKGIGLYRSEFSADGASCTSDRRPAVRTYRRCWRGWRRTQ